jgi:hypothetical protein
MRTAFFLLASIVACGGKLFGEGNPMPPVDGGAGTDSSDPFNGPGLHPGKCHFAVSFQPHGQPPIATGDADGVGTATAGAKTFSVTCSGTAQDTFYYALTVSDVPLVVGSASGMGYLKQTTNGREGEEANGACSVTVSNISADHKVSGTFDCKLVDDPIGTFFEKGTFTDVPLG